MRKERVRLCPVGTRGTPHPTPPPGNLPHKVGRVGLVAHQATQEAASSAGSWVSRPPSSTRGRLLRQFWVGRPPCTAPCTCQSHPTQFHVCRDTKNATHIQRAM